ncbi:ABC transporter substrate-binding protein [Blastochloris tepida]|uniref:ABC transporter substrate-binding protein n=1 Tax=Blastochloris tepida TaxID=2233851 RepID=A0A348G5M6_9HYPH|nr:ABC transporter substrate-binding protein [Blastochloris tepida]
MAWLDFRAVRLPVAVCAAFLAAALAAAPAHAQEAAKDAAGAAAPAKVWRHGLSLLGEPKEKPDFAHFGYVNPAAPKGGTARLAAMGTFDNLNPVVANVRGNIAMGLDLIYDTLMTPSSDEVGTAYGLLAEAVSFPPDFSSVSYRLRPEARWHDGKPVTPEDVIWSFEVWRKNSPTSQRYYQHVKSVAKTGPHEVTFTFDEPGNRELPQIVGEFQVMPRHWWEGTDSSGKKRDITATTLEAPLGGGAYRIKSAEPGRTIVYERVPDYWGAKLPVNVGINNFDEIRFEYFRDTTVALEAFKADQLDWRTESSAKDWATAYDFPAVAEKRVVLEEFPIRNLGIMQAFAFNLRREKFQDWRVRRAFDLAFDFEDLNQALFYGQYHRIGSYFDGTELAASGVPAGKELEMLEAVRDKVPPALFTEPYPTPKGGSPEATRANLREALKLLGEAGWEVKDRRLTNVKTGEPFMVEFLIAQPNFERVVLRYKPSLERLGIVVSVRTVDETQYQNRLRQFDFDIVVNSWGQSLSPGNEQRYFWGSEAADVPGTGNVGGIRNPAVDALIERVIFAKTREELVAATRALDRVLMWNHYVVPQWTYGKQRTARWDRFARPERMPAYGAASFPTIWWWDAERAEKTRQPARP